MKPTAFCYYRTSSKSGADGSDSRPRQREACHAWAKANGYTIVGEYWDKGISGTLELHKRPKFAEMLADLNGTRTIIVKSANRFARDAAVALWGHRELRKTGVELIAADSPEHFLDDSPHSKLIRTVLSGLAEFERDMVALRLARGRARKRKETGQCGGPTRVPDATIALARKLRRKNPHTKKRRSFQVIANELEKQGHLNPKGKPYLAGSVRHMLEK